jgi:hypothetical protein
MAATILSFAGVEPKAPLDGKPFLEAALNGEGMTALRDHVTVGWGGAATVVDDRWWLNVKMDGSGPFLYDLRASEPRSRNVADDNPDVVGRLYNAAMQDAVDGVPDYILELARSEMDAPGCSALAARPV